MNIALSSIILITLLLPGILFRTFIIKSDSFENPLDTSLKAEIGFILIASTLIHSIGLIICEYVIGLEIHLDQLYYLIIGDKDKIDFDTIRKATYLSIIYVFTQSILASIVAVILKNQALKKFWDIKTPYFPITSEWDNILSGRYYLYERNKELVLEKEKVTEKIKELEAKLKEKEDEKGRMIHKELKDKKVEITNKIKNQNMLFTKVDALVETQEELILYRGSVYEYFLSKKNKLDKITLYKSFRRPFKPCNKGEEEFYEFNSNLFIIDYQNIKNLNVRYWFAKEKHQNNLLGNTTPNTRS